MTSGSEKLVTFTLKQQGILTKYHMECGNTDNSNTRTLYLAVGEACKDAF